MLLRETEIAGIVFDGANIPSFQSFNERIAL
jgi:hypothetical protein